MHVHFNSIQKLMYQGVDEGDLRGSKYGRQSMRSEWGGPHITYSVPQIFHKKVYVYPLFEIVKKERASSDGTK